MEIIIPRGHRPVEKSIPETVVLLCTVTIIPGKIVIPKRWPDVMVSIVPYD